MAFGLTHFIAGMVFVFNFWREISARAAIGIIFTYTILGLLIPLSAGSVTGKKAISLIFQTHHVAALVSWIHFYSGIDMPTTEVSWNKYPGYTTYTNRLSDWAWDSALYTLF